MTVIAHKSDCSIHNAPAYAPGKCDCGALNIEEDRKDASLISGEVNDPYAKIIRAIGNLTEASFTQIYATTRINLMGLADLLTAMQEDGWIIKTSNDIKAPQRWYRLTIEGKEIYEILKNP